MQKAFKNLVRNRSSKILNLHLDYNEIGIEEFVGMMKEIESESQFGNLHFKLRILSMIGNPMSDLQYKIVKKIEEFYS